MEKRWKLDTSADEELVASLSKELNIKQALARLLVQRGIRDFDSAKKFFRPNLSHLYDPFLMKDMREAVSRLNHAISSNEKILIYGDYDVDGTTSVALVYSFLRNLYDNIYYYIPDRYTEGYGISYASIDWASENGYSLIIALDCGIKAVEKIEYAKTKNIDYIIGDHHTPGKTIPEAVAVLDPKQSDCTYPFRELSGCGVGFKFMQAFSLARQIPMKHIYEYLDLVVVSIASDIVPIVDENRTLAYFGLKRLNSHPCTGLKAIIDISGLKDKNISVSDIVFKIGPRINAAGRIESGREAVSLLIEQDEEMAKSKSFEINTCNNTRKDLDRDITEQALAMISENEALRKQKTTVLYNQNWHKGVLGIVASRLTESFYRPTIILTESQGFATGSARSVEGFDLYSAIEECSDLLENFGGHPFAAGLTMKIEKIPEFTERFETIVSGSILKEQLRPQLHVDSALEFQDITEKFFSILRQFMPFGPGNMKPVFATRDVLDYGTSKKVGKGSEHLKLELIENASGKIMNGIAFSMGAKHEFIKTKNSFSVCYTIEENIFNGYRELQLMIKDIKSNNNVFKE